MFRLALIAAAGLTLAAGPAAAQSWGGTYDAGYRGGDSYRSYDGGYGHQSYGDGHGHRLEQFAGAPGTTLNGHSVSTFDRNAKRWKQTWVDNTASYLDFTGGLADGKMVLMRDAERQGKKFLQRMVWQDIRADAFKWLWQRSDDGGATWSTQWEIDYRRAKQAN